MQWKHCATTLSMVENGKVGLLQQPFVRKIGVRKIVRKIGKAFGSERSTSQSALIFFPILHMKGYVARVKPHQIS